MKFNFSDDLKFWSCAYDPCFYIKRDKTKIIMITLYVDDLFSAGNTIVTTSKIKSELCKRFEMVG